MQQPVRQETLPPYENASSTQISSGFSKRPLLESTYKQSESSSLQDIPMHYIPTEQTESPGTQASLSHKEQPKEHSPVQLVGSSVEGHRFKTAIPLTVLSSGSCPVDCPECGVREMTTTTYQIGATTHAWAVAACLITALGCIPYLLSATKDVRHNCGNCGALLATWHRSGRTVVHAYA